MTFAKSSFICKFWCLGRKTTIWFGECSPKRFKLIKFLYLFIKKKKKKSEVSKSTPFGHGQRREPPPSKPTGRESPSIMRFLMELLFYFLALSAWSCFYNLNWYTFLLLLTKLSPNLIWNPTELFKFIYATFASYKYIYNSSSSSNLLHLSHPSFSFSKPC